MKNPVKHVFLIILTLVIMLSTSNLAQAQENWDIVLNQISTLETPDAMTLKVYFTVSEGRSGVPVMNAVFTGAQVTLLNTNFVANAVVQKPDIPIYIAIVMDASGSMGGSGQILTNAAKLALNDTPDDSLFSVIQFDEEITLLQDFTENLSAVSYAIDMYKTAGRGTCLYDAAYSAIEAMAKLPTGRRAVILFTDGKDEVASGEVCSQHRYQEVIDLAMKSQVPINTIGLSMTASNINAVELQAMAASTGAFSAIASKDDLPGAFKRIMDALKAQWMAEAVIYPRNGTNNAVLTLALTNNNTINSAFTIESETDYPGPPSPVSVNLAGLLLNAGQQAYEIQLSLTSPELAAYVKVEVWDVDGGSKTGEFVFNDPVEFNTFTIPTESLVIGHDYELRISVVSRADNTPFPIIRDDRGNISTQLIHEFTFDPSAAYPTINVQSVLENKGDLVMNVAITNPDLVGGFDGWLVNQDTNTQVPSSNFTFPALSSTTGAITVPMRTNRIPDGQYSVVVRILSKDGSVFSTFTYPDVVYNAPSIFKRIGEALIGNPIYLGGILGIIAVVVIFLMINSARQKSVTGTPVMQGRLGKSVGRDHKAKGPVIPVADDEPILMRAPSPAPPPPAIPRPPAAPPPSKPTGFPQPSFPTSYAQPPAAPTPVNPVPAPSMPTSLGFGDGATMVVNGRPQSNPVLTIMNPPATVALQDPVRIDQFPFVLGRTEGNLNIQVVSVSRRHAQITYDSSQQVYYLTDLNSSNGTMLNGQLLTPGRPVQLSHGAMISLGPNITIRFDLST